MCHRQRPTAPRARAATVRFRREEGGAIFLWLLVWSVVFLAFAGLAIDMSNMYRNRAMLQATADAAVHAALVSLRHGGTANEARQAAQDIARANLPRGQYGDIVDLVDIEIGTWTGSGVDTSSGSEAVRVSATREEAEGNAVPTSFLTVIGIVDLDVAVDALGVLEYPPCINDGIFARGRLKFTALNRFGGNLCLHGQTELKISGLDGEVPDPIGDGTIFSVPNTAEKGAGGNFNTSTPARALMEAGNHIAARNYDPIAASEGQARVRIQGILDAIDDYSAVAAAGVVPIKKDKTPPGQGNNGGGNSGGGNNGGGNNGGGNNGGGNNGGGDTGGDDGGDGGTETTEEGTDTDEGGGEEIVVGGKFKQINNPSNNYDLQADIDNGYLYFFMGCSNGGTYKFDGDVDLSNVVLVSTCALSTQGNDSVTMYNTIIAVDDPGNKKAMEFKGKSLNAATADSCGDYGKIVLLTTGGIQFTADTNFSQIEMVSTDEIKLTSKTDLTSGVSLQSYGEIDFSAKANVQGCNETPNDQSEFVPIARIAC